MAPSKVHGSGSAGFSAVIRGGAMVMTPSRRNRVAKLLITTTVPPNAPAGYFSMVREIAFPIVVGTRPQDYKVFVAFERNVAGAG